MKLICLLLLVIFMGCGAKTNEDIAKERVKEYLKITLPDFETNYEASNFGPLGTAFLPYEETELYTNHLKTINALNDSVIVVEKNIADSKGGNNYQARLQVLRDSIKIKSERNSSAKQSYTPEKLFKISHAYLVKEKSGLEKKTEAEFYIDKDLKKVVKMHKVY